MKVDLKFQYRKRYYPVATEVFIMGKEAMTIKFQYRKRYYPVATNWRTNNHKLATVELFQYRKRYYPVATKSWDLRIMEECGYVSIPQAVLSSCNLIENQFPCFLFK